MISDYEEKKQLIEIEHSEIESTRFDKKISRLMVAKNFDDEARVTTSIKHLIDKSDVLFLNSASKKINFHKILNEINVEYALIPNLIYWGRKGNIKKTNPINLELNIVKHKNLNQFEEIIENVFKKYPSHYSFNPNLSSIKMSEIYKEWGKNVLNSDDETGIIATDGNNELGMISFYESNNFIEVLLAGVVMQYQKKGNYVRMMEQFISTMCKGKDVYISTQIDNLNVQKSWIRMEFEPIFLVERFHCWKKK